jgi:hypothetical protein
MKDITGVYIQIRTPSNSPIESYAVIPFSPVLLLVDCPI